MRLVILLLSGYNLMFVPLQMAFRIKYTGLLITLEVLTIFFYLLDICLRMSTINHLKALNHIPDLKLNAQERKLKTDSDALEQRILV